MSTYATDILKAALTAAGSVVYLFFLAKIMGKRQISEMNLFDYIIGITIGSIAAELATYELTEVLVPVTAMLVYALFSVLASFFNDKSVGFRTFFSGRPTVLFNNGKFEYKEMSKKRIDIDEFMCQARTQGFFDLADVKTAVLENNGKISFLTYAASTPVTCSDMNIQGSGKEYATNVILDGEIQYKNLARVGIDENKITKELESNNLKLGNVMLAYCDSNQKVTMFPKSE